VTYGAVSALVLAVVVLAAWLPARRAAATDPMTVLREQ
jgi:ABC-type lipoprotein release transport system permease subunit